MLFITFTCKAFLCYYLYIEHRTYGDKSGILCKIYNKRQEEFCMTGIPFLIVFVLAIVAMIVMISKFKVHPFLSIMLVSLILGLLGGIPFVNTTDADGNTVNGIATVIGSGFSSTFTSIGIVIIFGAMIGTFLEATGAALKLADMVVKLVGPKHPELAIELMDRLRRRIP